MAEFAGWNAEMVALCHAKGRVGYKNEPPLLDAKLIWRLGYTPAQAAEIVMGFDPRGLDRVLAESRKSFTDLFHPQGEATSDG